jgi:hypothetical protein
MALRDGGVLRPKISMPMVRPSLYGTISGIVSVIGSTFAPITGAGLGADTPTASKHLVTGGRPSGRPFLL